jgi:hypothetical protein
MRVSIQTAAGQEDYRFTFSHEQFHTPIPLTNFHQLPSEAPMVQGRSLCVIERIMPDGDQGVVGSGMTFCSVKDNFSKEEGRKKSLKRALADCFPTQGRKPTRAAFWQAYFSRGQNGKASQAVSRS